MIDCKECKHHTYDYYMETYEEFIICKKEHWVFPDECDDFEEFE